MFICVFFFKQKTAYEMRISDGSSDVCSSDLIASGTPIVGILDPDGEIGQMVKETGCGVLVDPVGEEIAAVIRDLMVDPVKRSAMSAAARQIRSAERREGKECVITCSSRWSLYN